MVDNRTDGANTPDLSSASLREQITADIIDKTGIDEAVIERLVRAFYRRVQEDDLLGPVFAARIVDWEPHLQRMFSFWHSVALMSGRYKGQPMAKHLPLPVDARHFDRWLELFEEPLARPVRQPPPTHFVKRAQMIAESLELGIAASQGIALRRGARFLRSDADS